MFFSAISLVRFFVLEIRKILDLQDLAAEARVGALQNIVKEGLTRKIFQNKDLC